MPGQKTRKPKTSNGINRGAKRNRQDPLFRVLLGQGLYRNINKPNFGKKVV